MNFYSLGYLCFVTIFFILYWGGCKTKNAQNILLTCASYIFYGLFDWRMCFLLLFTSIVTYFAGLQIKIRESKPQSKKIVLVGYLVLVISILGIFKYCNFFIGTANDLLCLFGNNLRLSSLNIVLPIGISFYTFSAISYCVDIYRGKTSATNNIVECLLFISFFPSILSGPINRSERQLPQFEKKRIFNGNLILSSALLFIIGAFMKLCVADRLSLYVDAVYGNLSHHHGLTFLLASVFYTLQIYADFAGYSLMAIGSGGFFGINIEQNFRQPYFSKSITEFWSRWHMSLTRWLKDYLYIPLGGNRVSKQRWMFNIMVVFLISGLWHGAAFTFIIWGAIHGLFQIGEKLIYGEKLKHLGEAPFLLKLLRGVITFMIISFAWIFFRMPSVEESIYVISNMFSNIRTPFVDVEIFVYAGISLALMTIIDIFLYKCNNNYNQIICKHPIASFILSVFLFFYILMMGQFEGDSFIYFQF